MNPLVSTQWLAGHLDEVVTADASWYMPSDKRDPRAEFEMGHIPGAVFFDIDAISDKGNPLPHMLPTAEVFSARLTELGIATTDMIVVYDGTGIFSAPRAWWMIKAMGHDNVRVLDGGFPKWKAAGHPIEGGKALPRSGKFSARLDAPQVRDFAQVKAALGKTQILDARGAPRFEGSVPEPRPGLKAGHMPGASNVPWNSLLNPDNTMKDDAALKEIFAARKVDLAAPIITTCGTGVTAATIALALAKLGARDVALYDGSWTEWGGRDDAPIVTGP